MLQFRRYIDRREPNGIRPDGRDSGYKPGNLKTRIRNAWQLYLLLLFPLVHLIIFAYVPMYGARIAFMDYSIARGMAGSSWVGLKHFRTFFQSYLFWRLLRNTLGLSLYSLAASFFVPVLFALSLNYISQRRIKRTAQLIAYAPYFISTVVMAGIILEFLAPDTGVINGLLRIFGGRKINFIAKPELFKSIFVWSDVWQTTGYSSVIYLAALAGIDPGLHEAAIVDGASKLQRVWHVDLPGLVPTIVILLLLRIAYILDVGFEKILLLQNPFNLRTSEVIDTYVYKIGIASTIANFSYASAVGLFKSLVGLFLLLMANSVLKRTAGSSLW